MANITSQDVSDAFIANSQLKDRIKELLLDCLNRHLVKVAVLYRDDKDLFEYVGDARLFGDQRNLGAALNIDTAKEYLNILRNPRYQLVRWDFIYNTTVYLKMQLGGILWQVLIEDLYQALKLHNNLNINKTESALSNTNQEIIEPKRQVLENNHWLVVTSLYGMYPETFSIVQDFLLNLEESIGTRQSRNRGGR